MPKRPIGGDVLDAARARIADTFDNFDRIYVSFSAGKDSTVMLHLVADEAAKRGRKFGVLLVDLEGQYALTIDHARELMDTYAEHLDPYWVCLPISLRNAVSVYEPTSGATTRPNSRSGSTPVSEYEPASKSAMRARCNSGSVPVSV